MKSIRIIIILVGIMSLLAGKEAYAETSLQSKIEAIPEGGTLNLHKGVYHERIVLKKSVHLIGEKGTTFTYCSSKPVITIKGNDVSIRGVNIKACEKGSDTPAIFMSGKNHEIDGVSIDSGGVGVKLVNTENAALTNIRVSGMGENRGFDLWQSNLNTFKGIQMDHVQDGFYMENSHWNTFIGNKISDSRYGLHVMFSDNITIKNNVSTRNFTGAMVMATHHSIIQGNKLMDNNQNVNAQGLLLYDVHQSTVQNNLIDNNRVGIYMDHSSENEITTNQINANFIGAQLNKISNNRIEKNSFISNVNELQAAYGNDNLIRHNYWDAAWKLDTDGDGTSNLPYRADPYFLNLIGETPEYQLFFQHPGMLLLQKMLKSPEQGVITDESPIMKNVLAGNTRKKGNKKGAWMMSTSMIAVGLLFIYVGRKRQ